MSLSENKTTTEQDLPCRFFLMLGVTAIWLLIYIIAHETITARYQAKWAPDAKEFSIPAAIVKQMSLADIVALKTSFDKGADLLGKCIICHDVSAEKSGKARFGPPLYGLLVKDAASQPDYEYSPALKSMAATEAPWSPLQLAAFIHKPDGFADKTRMPFPGLSDISEIRDLVHYFAWSFCDNDCDAAVLLRIDLDDLKSRTSADPIDASCEPLPFAANMWISPFSRDDVLVLPVDHDRCRD